MYPIHDLFIRSVEPERLAHGTRLELIRYSDHLLRRFGQAEVVFLEANQIRSAKTREIADEVWVLVAGSALFSWLDQRSSSPTRGAAYKLSCDKPTLVLVPFGVQFEVRAEGNEAQLIRLTTHESDDE